MKTSNRSGPSLVVAGVLAMGLFAVAPVHAQSDSELPFQYIARSPAIISGQVQMAIEQQRQALRLLPGATDKASLAAVRKLAYDSYVLVRYAVYGVEGLRQMPRYAVNPLLKIQYDMMEVVRDDLRGSITALDEAMAGQPNRISLATEYLKRALDRLESVGALM